MTVAASSTTALVRPSSTSWFGFTARQHLVASVVFAAITVAFFFPLMRGDTLSEVAERQRQVYPWAGETTRDDFSTMHFDQTDSFYPWQVFMSRALREGEFPLWNPYSFGGAPFFANGQSGALYPPRVALTYTASPTRAHDLLLVTHFFLAGAAMFLLLGFGGVSFLSALVGALAWMLNSFALAWQALEHYVVIGAWLPIGVLLVHATIRRRSWPAAFLLSIVLGLMFLGGNALFVELAGVAIVGYGVGLAIATDRLDWRALGGSIARLATSLTLFAGLIAVALLPLLKLSAESARITVPYEELDEFALDWAELVHLVTPPPDPVANDPYHRDLFAGSAVAILALVGLFRRAALARFAAVLGILTILFMLHTPVTLVADQVLPGLGNLKPLSRAAFLLQFSLAVLAAFGLDLVRQWLRAPTTGRLGAVVARTLGRSRMNRGSSRWYPAVVGAVGGAAAAGLLIGFEARLLGSAVAFILAVTWPPAAALAFELGRRDPSRPVAPSPLVIGALVGALSGAVAAGLVVGFVPSDGRFWTILAAGVLAVVLATALVLAARKAGVATRVRSRALWFSRVAATVVAAAVAASIVWQADAWADDVMQYQPNRPQQLYPSTPLQRYLGRQSTTRFLPTGPSFRGSTTMISSLPSASGYESLVPRRTENLWQAVAGGLPWPAVAANRRSWAYHPEFVLSELRPALLARAGVAHVVAPPTDKITSRSAESGKIVARRPSGREGAVASQSDTITWYTTPDGKVVFRERNFYDPANPYDTGRPSERNSELVAAYGPFDPSWEGAVIAAPSDAITWYRTPDGKVVFRERNFYDPANPYDTGRPSERNSELVAAFGPFDSSWEGDASAIVPNGLDLRYDGRDGRVFSVAGVVPPAYVVGGCEYAATPLSALRRFVNPAFDVRRNVILESRGAAAACRTSIGGRVGVASVTDRSLDGVRVAVDASRSGWLVLTESWDDGWHAEVDGNPVEVSPANYAFRAVPIDPGHHVVTFSYQPSEIRTGAAVSAAALLVSTLGFATIYWRSRRRPLAALAREG